MPTVTVNKGTSGVGQPITGSDKLRTPVGLTMEIPVPKGRAGVLTTRTDGTTGVVTLSAGHGYTSGFFVLFSSAGRQYDCQVTIVGNAATITGSRGDGLPEQGAQVVMTSPVTFIFPFASDSLEFLAIHPILASDAEGILVAVSTSDSEGENIVDILPESGRLDTYFSHNGDVMPWTGQGIHNWSLAHGSSQQDMTFRLTALFDPTSESSS